MPGLIKSAVIAVSTTVVNPAAPPAQAPQWIAPPAATLAVAVEQWAEQAGQPKPVIDSRIGAYDVGQLSIRGQDFCTAVSKLAAALSYAAMKPQVAECAAGKPLALVAVPRTN